MGSITANSLKTRGVSAIAEALTRATEALVSVRGKDCYVVMDLEHYQYLRESELIAALAESRSDLEAGRFVEETVDEHLKRLDELA
ncbi:MAG: hypothetical protein L0H63_05595 [Nitrococcus sp.]|nr:hypothetical protein [Nitrococcus sp.]MDN5871844.1 hypothetical protein [Nitrococcus sp.]